MYIQSAVLRERQQGERRCYPHHGTSDNQWYYGAVQLKADHSENPLGCEKQPSQRQECTLSNKSTQLELQLSLGLWIRIINKNVYLHNDNVNRIPDNIWQIVIELSLEYTEFTPRELSVLLLEESHIFVSESSFYRILHERGLL